MSGNNDSKGVLKMMYMLTDDHSELLSDFYGGSVRFGFGVWRGSLR
jgi:hypothetical protein